MALSRDHRDDGCGPPLALMLMLVAFLLKKAF